jgi:aconitate hydratase
LLPEYEEAIKTAYGTINGGFNLGSVIFAVKPGDGSAREQAASSQRVLGGAANIAREYATKRYRSNLINWGMLPLVNLDIIINKGDIIIIPNVRKLIESGVSELPARIVSEGAIKDTVFSIGSLTGEEREIILAGCLMNYYKKLNEVKK